MKTSDKDKHPKKTSKHLMLKIDLLIKRLLYFEYSPRYVRLEGDLLTYKEVLNTYSSSGSKKEEEWIAKARILVEKAEQKMLERNIDEGWKLLHAARRMEAFAGKEKRKALVIQLREEAVKLNEWRKNSILKLVGVSGEKTIGDISGKALEKALKTRDEFYHTLYYTNRLTNAQFNWLFVLIALWIGLILVYLSACKGLDAGYKMGVMNFQNLTGVLLFGLLGSTTSAIFRFRNSQSSSRIPEILSNMSITLSRVFVGAGFSVFIFLLLNSKIAAAIDVFNFSLDSCYEFFTVAFVSGFSERLALKSIQNIIGKKE